MDDVAWWSTDGDSLVDISGFSDDGFAGEEEERKEKSGGVLDFSTQLSDFAGAGDGDSIGFWWFEDLSKKKIGREEERSGFIGEEDEAAVVRGVRRG
ncbi:hypothetical protein HAX54_005240, partial [Datura stramonium]|nr:hypothetical protein [Datura stramonium]